MIGRGELRLGQRVLYGACREVAVVDGICREWVGLRMERGGYVIAKWEDVYAYREESCASGED